ncbi:efflux RND transporter periplasmic adaptor subunit [bacterium]|nr:efflux RND transporter periplasmic adaptor subunit [bacterium]
MKKFKAFLPLIIILGAVVLFLVMTKLRTAPHAVEQEEHIPTISVKSFSQKTHTIKLTATGTVRSETAVTLLPEVVGKIVFISKKMNRGGYFRKGDLLFRIDSREYALQVESASAAVEQQEVRYQTELAQAKIAKEEWESFQKDNPDAEAGELTLREPQLKMAQANLDAAKAQLNVAKLRLAKTEIHAPFKGRVVERRVGKGQFVAMGSQLATIISTEKIEIALPLPVEEVALVPLDKKPEALIYITGKKEPIKGIVVRSAAQLDARSRMLDLIVAISPSQKKNSGTTLIDGAFVSVHIMGKEMKNLFVIPRELFHGEELWIDDGGLLKILKPQIIAHEKEHLIISGKSLPATISIVSSMLEIAVDGAKLQVAK